MFKFFLMLLAFLPLFSEGCNVLLEEVLSKYTRDITVLEIGESPTELLLQTAKLLPNSVFISMGLANGSFSLEVGETDLAKNLIWLDFLPNSKDIGDLSLSEHFDVIIINEFKNIKLDQLSEIINYCHRMSHHVIVRSKGEEAYVLENNLPFIILKRTCYHPRTISRTFTVYYDYNQKYLVKVRPPYNDQKGLWIPGINLITYLSFNGGYPKRADLISNLPIDFDHRDWMPNNMIIQGKAITLIDKNDPYDVANKSSRFYEREFPRVKQLILESESKSRDQAKKIFGRIYDIDAYLQVSEID